MDKLKCCHMECNNNADVEIKFNEYPDGYTHACIKHVGDLLSDGTSVVYVLKDGK